jgi:hypothetical protein
MATKPAWVRQQDFDLAKTELAAGGARAAAMRAFLQAVAPAGQRISTARAKQAAAGKATRRPGMGPRTPIAPGGRPSSQPVPIAPGGAGLTRRKGMGSRPGPPPGRGDRMY